MCSYHCGNPTSKASITDTPREPLFIDAHAVSYCARDAAVPVIQKFRLPAWNQSLRPQFGRVFNSSPLSIRSLTHLNGCPKTQRQPP